MNNVFGTSGLTVAFLSGPQLTDVSDAAVAVALASFAVTALRRATDFAGRKQIDPFEAYRNARRLASGQAEF